jgi:hypothetical protein
MLGPPVSVYTVPPVALEDVTAFRANLFLVRLLLRQLAQALVEPFLVVVRL